ncbi:MAG: carbohydrate binding domain-containing protein [Flavobacteriales bacterium]|nr:carbohydrate binding domain-containing protein [Flavobacteriales bacterium]MBP9080985.1 carbohydrate binding domain-containing protein [Flavobacteriales bacterium]
MRTAVLLSTFAFAGMASAQLFQSGLEDWTGTTPDGWMGSKSSIAATSVTQASDNVHGGTYAVRLDNASDSHKRFTTQPIAVTSGQNYEVSFWVRGSGEVRVGLYDGRPGGSSGYATYSPYTMATAAWQQVTVSIAAAHDTTGGEFILSVRNTVAPEHIVIDDVTIGDAAPLTPMSIYAIQYTTDPNGDSPVNGQSVMTGGIVTAVMPGDGYFIQSGSGLWNGVYVYDQDNTPAMGDSVTFTCSVSEYFNLTELSGVSAYTLVSSGNTIPAAYDVATGDVSLEPLESVLVRVNNAACTEAPSGANFGKYKVDDGSGDATIGKVIYTTTPDPVLGTAYNVTGVNYYTFGEYNIQPRMASDVDFATAVRESDLSGSMTVGPNPASDLLHVNLGQAGGSSVEYALTDMQGRTVQSGSFSGSQGTINVAGRATGLYHLTLRSKEQVKSVAVQVVR